jgi:hypothetical protein
MIEFRTRFLAVVMSAAACTAHAQAASETPSPFDGAWDVTLTCPAHHEDDDAKGYTHRFPAEIRNGVFRGTHGTEGQPSWHLLTGTLAPDGSAMLKLDGIVNNPAYAINDAQRGKPYTYRVRAAFEPTSGTGQRLGKRKCEFRFQRR